MEEEEREDEKGIVGELELGGTQVERLEEHSEKWRRENEDIIEGMKNKRGG